MHDREMKDSGIEWINNIPNNWSIHPVSYYYGDRKNKNVGVKEDNLLSLSYGNIIRKDINTSEGLLPASFSTYNIVEPGDIIIRPTDLQNDKRSLRTGLVSERGIITSAYIDLAPKRNVDSRYFHYLLHVYDVMKVFYNMGNGVRQGLNYDEFSRLMVFEPPLSEQHRIADFLDSKCSQIDEISKKIQEEINTLEEYKKSVITEVVTKGLDPNAEMKDSGIEWIGKIPKDWSVIKITRMLDYTHPYPIGDGDHGLIKTDRYTDNGIPYLRVQNLGWGTDLSLDNVVYISPEDNRRIESSTLYPGDVLFAKTGATIGKSGIVPSFMKIANTTSHVGKITVSKAYNSRYVYYCFASNIVYRQLWQIAGLKSTRPELSIDEIKTIRLVVPKAKSQQNEIVNYLDCRCKNIDEAILQKRQQLSTLEEYKKSLIYEYVTGKKEVKAIV